MTSPPDRISIHVLVTPDAHGQWHEFAAEQGCSVSSLLEVLAPTIATAAPDPLVRAARKLDADRRHRRR